MLEGNIELRPGRRVGPTEERLRRGIIDRQLRDAVPVQNLLDEAPVSVRDLLLQLLGDGGRIHSGALVFRWDHDVDTVWLAVDVLIDPVQLDLELFRGERQSAEHSHPAGLANRRNDVATI